MVLLFLPSASKRLECHVSLRVVLLIVLNEHIQSCGRDAGDIQSLRPLHEADSCRGECQYCNTTRFIAQSLSLTCLEGVLEPQRLLVLGADRVQSVQIHVVDGRRPIND